MGCKNKLWADVFSVHTNLLFLTSRVPIIFLSTIIFNHNYITLKNILQSCKSECSSRLLILSSRIKSNYRSTKILLALYRRIENVTWSIPSTFWGCLRKLHPVLIFQRFLVQATNLYFHTLNLDWFSLNTPYLTAEWREISTWHSRGVKTFPLIEIINNTNTPAFISSHLAFQ